MNDTGQITGKATELGLLNQSLQAIGAGQPQVSFISGPAGIGKSTLIHHVEFPKGYQTFETIVLEEESPSYSIIANLLRQSEIITGFAKKEGQLTEYLGYFLPEYRSKIMPEANFDQLVQVLRRIIARLALRGPVVWIIEDLQWADTASLDIISNLLPWAKELPLGIWATYRDETISREHPLRKARSKLRRYRWFSEIRLLPFTEKEIFDFITKKYTLHPDSNLTSTLHYQTGGLPLLVNEIAETLQKKNLIGAKENNLLYLKQIDHFPIPENVRDLVVLQMDELSADAKELAEIAASFSMEFPIAFLETFVSSADVVDELIEKGIVLEKNPGTAAFRHALFREAIRSEIPWSKRRDIYQRIAGELEKQDAPQAVLADFYNKAGMKDKARPAFIRSARESCKLHAYQDAARWAGLALDNWTKGEDETERTSVLEEFAHCSKISGNLDNAIKALTEITESELVKGDKKRLADIYRRLAVTFGLKGSWAQYKQHLIKASSLFQEAGMPKEAASDYMELAERLMGELDLFTATGYIEKAVNLAKESGQRELLARTVALQGYIQSFRGNTETGVKLAREAVAMALGTNNVSATAETYRRLAGTMEYASSFKQSIDVYETAYQFCSTNKLDYHETQCLGCMSWVLMRLGDWKRCFETCREIIEHPGSEQNSKATANSVLAIIRSYRGEIKTARKHLVLANQFASGINSAIHKLLNKWPEALIAQVENDTGNTQRLYSEMLDLWFLTEDRHDLVPGLCEAASFFALQNDQKELNRSIQALTVISNAGNNPEATGILSFAIGASLSLNHEQEHALNHFQKAIEYLKPVSIPLQSAIIGFHLGLSCQAIGLNEEAENHFQSAYHSFKNLGVRYWCSIIDQYRLPGKNEPPDNLYDPAPGLIHSSLLTDRQLEILKLLASGLSNKEIADKIYLSTRTVDMHIRNIYDRLNCRSRTEATRIAVDSGMV
jgi:DNA-binding CsgD family transcriptional regulator